MTGHRDPVDAWLSADVDLLLPPQGTFERIRRRARRRRAVRAVSATAGVAVIVAAVATLPQITSALLPGSGGPASVTGLHPAGIRSGHPSAVPSKPAATAPGHTPAPAGSAGPPLPGTGRPAAGFAPTSVTFVGPSTGAVLGLGRSGCAKGACTAVAGTADYGRTWSAMGAPPSGVPNGGQGVSQIRFLDLRDGWAYGPQLYATHDGGARWAPVTAVPGRVVDLATVGSRVFAVAASCTGGGPEYSAGCTSFALYSADAGSGKWQRVAGASAAGPVFPGGLQLTGQRGYLLEGGRLFTGPVTAGAWHAVAPSGGEPACLAGAGTQTALIAPNGTSLFLACPGAAPAGHPGTPGSLMLYLSADGGQTWQPRGTIPAAGTATSLAVSPAGTLVLATAAGIWYSPDARTWHQASLGGPTPPGGFLFAGMTSVRQGVAVPAGRAGHEVFITLDGGHSWQASVIQ